MKDTKITHKTHIEAQLFAKGAEIKHKEDVEALLVLLRKKTLADDKNFGSHQLNAHLSLAYACEQPPEPWEIYRIPSLHCMPSTSFFINHANEIQEALKPKATWELLRTYAEEKIAFETNLSDQERKMCGYYPRKVHYCDIGGQWVYVDVPSIPWFDEREIIRKYITEIKDELLERVNSRLVRMRQNAAKAPILRKLEELAGYEKYAVGKLFKERLKKFDEEKKNDYLRLAKLNTTRDFGKALFTLLRETENEVRATRGMAAIGEAWVRETELLYRVRELLPNVEVIAHGRPKWLGRQHLDIWIPAYAVGIEYHGLQHFKSVDFFGGEEAFRRTQERDNRKRALCEKNGLRLIEINYDQNINDSTLIELISKN